MNLRIEKESFWNYEEDRELAGQTCWPDIKNWSIIEKVTRYLWLKLVRITHYFVEGQGQIKSGYFIRFETLWQVFLTLRRKFSRKFITTNHWWIWYGRIQKVVILNEWHKNQNLKSENLNKIR